MRPDHLWMCVSLEGPSPFIHFYLANTLTRMPYRKIDTHNRTVLIRCSSVTSFMFIIFLSGSLWILKMKNVTQAELTAGRFMRVALLAQPVLFTLTVSCPSAIHVPYVSGHTCFCYLTESRYILPSSVQVPAIMILANGVESFLCTKSLSAG